MIELAAGMAFYLGIDGGGTTTTCVVGDEMSVLARASAGGSNAIRLGETEAANNLQEVISEACTQAGVSPLKITAACLGVAGAVHPDVNAMVRRVASTALPRAEIQVVGDMVIAMQAALRGAPGVVVIAGTGSIGYGRNSRGETARAGGWGFAISDEGSGHWIGRQAVAGVVRALDAGHSTTLLDHLLQTWRLPDAVELVRFGNQVPPPNFAELFPHVVQAGEQNDPVAAEILSRAGGELAQLALVVMGRLWSSVQPVDVGMVGGVFEHSPQVRRAFKQGLLLEWPQAAVGDTVADAVLGALEMARMMTREALISHKR
ncbi:MAG TPA: BadF/BadG/BcrA/BcrD ATPase family protein [Terriglobales bacterium]|nr:BadF/BadG/BcrA/BcrD ATPase family protein [Terriglobales bacterium]